MLELDMNGIHVDRGLKWGSTSMVKLQRCTHMSQPAIGGSSIFAIFVAIVTDSFFAKIVTCGESV